MTIAEHSFRFCAVVNRFNSYCIKKNALDGCLCIEREGCFQRRRQWGDTICGSWVSNLETLSKLGGPVCCGSASDLKLRELKYRCTKGKTINRNSVSSGKRKRIRQREVEGELPLAPCEGELAVERTVKPFHEEFWEGWKLGQRRW